MTHVNKAPLVQTDINELGDKRLNEIEAIAKIKEDTAKLVESKKIPNQKLLENREMALGRPMDYTDFIFKVSKLNPAIIFQDGGFPKAIAVCHTVHGEKKYITGFLKTVLPEFSAVIVDDKGLIQKGGVGEVRGWRSVLLSLIKAGALTEKQVNLTFGPAMGQRAVLWDAQLQARR